MEEIDYKCSPKVVRTTASQRATHWFSQRRTWKTIIVSGLFMISGNCVVITYAKFSFCLNTDTIVLNKSFHSKVHFPVKLWGRVPPSLNWSAGNTRIKSRQACLVPRSGRSSPGEFIPYGAVSSNGVCQHRLFLFLPTGMNRYFGVALARSDLDMS